MTIQWLFVMFLLQTLIIEVHIGILTLPCLWMLILKTTLYSFGELLDSRKSEFLSLRQWWDYEKVEIRQLCQQYTLGVTHTIIRSMNDLETKMVEIQSSIEITGNRGQIEILKSKRAVLADPVTPGMCPQD